MNDERTGKTHGGKGIREVEYGRKEAKEWERIKERKGREGKRIKKGGKGAKEAYGMEELEREKGGNRRKMKGEEIETKRG